MPYTDYFGQPLKEGDEVIYPTSSGTNRACFSRYKVEKIIPLVKHRSRSGMMREDQARLESPSVYPMAEPDKAFVIQVMKNPRWGSGKARKFTIRFCENVVRVPDGA